MKVAKLVEYPILYAPGTEVEELTIDHEGTQYDRRLVIVDMRNIAVVPEVCPKIERLRLARKNGSISIRSEVGNLPECRIEMKMPVSHGICVEISIAEKLVKGYDMGTSVAEWFSDALKLSCRVISVFPHLIDSPRKGNIRIVTASLLRDVDEGWLRNNPQYRYPAVRPHIVIDGLPPALEVEWRSFFICGANLTIAEHLPERVMHTIIKGSRMPTIIRKDDTVHLE